MTHAYNDLDESIFFCNDCSRIIRGNIYDEEGKLFLSRHEARINPHDVHYCADCGAAEEENE